MRKAFVLIAATAALVVAAGARMSGPGKVPNVVAFAGRAK